MCIFLKMQSIQWQWRWWKRVMDWEVYLVILCTKSHRSCSPRVNNVSWQGSKQGKRASHGICSWWCYAMWINEVTMGLWLLLILHGDLNNTDLPICWALLFLIPRNEIEFMSTSSVWYKMNEYYCSHLILLLLKLHASPLMNVQSRYRSPCCSLEAFRWLLRRNVVSSVSSIPWERLVVQADTTPHSWQRDWYDGACSFQNEHINGHQNHSAEPHMSIPIGDLVLCFKIFGKYSGTGNTHPTSNFFHVHLGIVLMASIFTLPLCSVDPASILRNCSRSLARVCY